MNLKAIRDLREEGKSMTLDDTATFGERSLGQLIMIACDRLFFLMGENEGLKMRIEDLKAEYKKVSKVLAHKEEQWDNTAHTR